METDHRPLEYIFKPKASGKLAPARVVRWLLRLQECDFTVIYRPGPQNLADALSRLANNNLRSNMESCADRYVHYLAEQLTPVAMNTGEIQEHSKNDPELIQEQPTSQASTSVQILRARIEHRRQYHTTWQSHHSTGKTTKQSNRISSRRSCWYDENETTYSLKVMVAIHG